MALAIARSQERLAKRMSVEDSTVPANVPEFDTSRVVSVERPAGTSTMSNTDTAETATNLLEVWLPAPDGSVFDPDMDTSDWGGRIVKMEDKTVGHIEEVLEVRPDGVKVRMYVDFMVDSVPWYKL